MKQFSTIEIRQLYTELMASSYLHTFSYLAGIFSQPIQVHLVKIGIIGGNWIIEQSLHLKFWPLVIFIIIIIFTILNTTQ